MVAVSVPTPIFPTVVEEMYVFPNVLVPEKMLLLARSVEEAAKIVMSAVPLKETPLMLRPVWSWVAEPALPEIEPVIVWEKVLAPEKVLESAKSVEEAKVQVDVEKEYRSPVEETPTAPVERFLKVTDEVAVMEPDVRLPTEVGARYEFVRRSVEVQAFAHRRLFRASWLAPPDGHRGSLHSGPDRSAPPV